MAGMKRAEAVQNDLLFDFPPGVLTPHITGSKKQSEKRAALLAVRMYVIVGRIFISQRNAPIANFLS